MNIDDKLPQNVYEYHPDGSATWQGYFIPARSVFWNEPRDIDKNGRAIGRISGREQGYSVLFYTKLPSPFSWVHKTWANTDGHIPTLARFSYLNTNAAAKWFQTGIMENLLRLTHPDVFDLLFIRSNKENKK